jgi:hypothetical protein
MLKVVAAAMRVTPGGEDPRKLPIIISAPPPARHHNLFAIIYNQKDDEVPEEEQGFLLSDGTFADRVKAAIVAQVSGQLTKPMIAYPWLFSEDLW